MIIADAVETVEGEGMVVHRALPTMAIARVDPFLLLDHMGPWEHAPGEAKGAPDHPHRGFETVTYLLQGAFEHEDSQGNMGRLEAGDVQWMTAGDGVVHSEMPAREVREKGGTVEGLQLWVNLPATDKRMAPRYQDIRKADIPEVEVEGGTVRIIAGSFGGTSAVIDTRTPITYLHTEIDGSVDLPFPDGHDGFVYVLRGQGTIGGHAIHGRQIARVGAPVRLEGRLSAILVTGRPIHEPVVQWGPFVMNTRAEILQAVRDYESGRFGTIKARFDTEPAR